MTKFTIFLILIVVVAFLLVVVIMVQNPKGGGLSSSLGGGGAEKMAALQSKILQDNGYSVFVVSVLDKVEYPYSGKLLNLGALQAQKNYFFRRLTLLFVLKRFLKAHKIDVIIDHRTRVNGMREFLLKNIIYRTKTIFVVHSHNSAQSFPKSEIPARFCRAGRQLQANWAQQTPNATCAAFR